MRGSITIVELLVVVAIVAIMASIAGPNLNTWTCRQDVENDFSSLNGFLNTLRLRSVSQNRSLMAKVYKNGLKAHYSNKKCKGLSDFKNNSTFFHHVSITHGFQFFKRDEI